jgi:hypothetical protein
MPTGELPEDISEMAEKAKTIAEATGRTEEDVLTDLLDDGKANMSAGQDIEKMDFLDKAQEQAEKFKKLLTTLIPVLALLLSIGAEGMGVMDITSWGSDSVWGDENNDDPFTPPSIRWGCMDSDALNYDETANEDDGTCEFEEDCPDDDGDGICNDDEIEGCMDDEAENYDEDATDDDDSCIYPPPPCDITLYDILLETNNSSAYIQYDLDCGSDDNAEGFNVSVQFWNTIANTTDTVNYSIGFHYIQGDVGDVQELYLHNITSNTYDFKWIAIWEDEDGNNQDLYETWSDIYMAGEN